VCKDDEDTEDDIYLQVLEYIQEVETKIEKKTDEELVPPQFQDKWKVAFTCQDGAFEPLVMFFGLCNSPGMFQTMMNEIFHDMAVVVMVYIDDILMKSCADYMPIIYS